jgi:RimJ/RimL family protein N-acetyltransferase
VIIRDQLPSLRKWVECRLECELGPCITLGYEKEGKMLAVVAFHGFRKTSAEITIATTSPRWGAKLFLKEIFGYGFSNWNRLTALIAIDNEESIRLVERLGFIREGTLRQSSDDGRDMHLYGMLKQECRWI